MSKLYRSLLCSGLVVAGITACGDDVTVNEPTPTVHSISVAPDGVSIPPGSTLQMIEAVNADQGVATTVSWSVNTPATIASISATGLLTATAPGQVGVRACSTVNTSVCGNATITITNTAPAVSGVTVTPANASYVVGQTPVTYTASVQGSNNPPQTVTWSTASNTTAVVSVSAAGVVTINAPGTEVVKACSTVTGFTTVCGSAQITVVAQAATSISMQKIEQNNTTVDLSNVAGQVDVTVNADPGTGTINKVQVLINGVVAAEQTFTGPSAPAVAGDGSTANAQQPITLSLNTAMVKQLANNLYVPVFFNGPAIFSAKLFLNSAPTTAIPSTNVIPVVLKNTDALLSAPAFVLVAATPANTAPGNVVSGGAPWFKGNVTFTGGNYVSFFPVTPTSGTMGSTGGCGTSGNAISGTPQTGLTFSGTLTCGSTVEGAVNINGTVTITPGTAPAADVVDIPSVGFSQVGTAYVVAGENRFNLLAGGSAPAATPIWIDNKAPSIVVNEIGFVSGCSLVVGFPIPGCWVNASYNLAGDFVSTDAGSNTVVEVISNWVSTSISGVVTCGATLFNLATLAEDASSSKYDACVTSTDALGNSNTARGNNVFGLDKTAPTITYAIDPLLVGMTLYAPASTLAQQLLEAVPTTQRLDWKVNDNNAGLDTATALVVATVGTTLNPPGCVIAINGALNAEPAPGADRFMLPINAPFPDAGCGDPGYYHYQATVTDRAGNSASDVDRRFGFEPGVPSIAAIAPTLLYGGGTAATVTMFASHTGASLSGAKTGIWYTSNVPVATPVAVQLVYDQGLIFNAPFQVPLFLTTPLAGTPMTVPASSVLAGIVLDSTEAPVSAFDSVTAIIRDVFDGAGFTGALVHADTANLVIPAPFIDASKVSTSATVWANPKMGTPIFTTVGSTCTFTYATPSNGATIPTSVQVLRTIVANIYDVLFPISAAPSLISDNGTTRIYRYLVSGSSTCATLAGSGTLRLLAVQNDSAGLPVGYLVP